MKLAIISHTEHYVLSDETIVGVGSTITEINHLTEVFDEIIHLAMLHNETAPKSALPYTSSKIKFIPIPKVGGKKTISKFKIIYNAPKTIRLIREVLKTIDYFQFRAPTGIGVFVIPYLIFSSKKGWFKYAGNWKQVNAPLAYKIQKWYLIKQKRTVTINGNWIDQPKHCLTFENPCLTDEELEIGRKIINKRILPKVYNFCFVGRIEKEKGIDLIIEIFNKLPIDIKQRIGIIHIVGTGKEKNKYRNLSNKGDVKFNFHGMLSRIEVHNIYMKSHAILLPSKSEGFPKVIAEAMNYGCIPIVSDVSSISQYIFDGKNGFLLKENSINELSNKLYEFFSMDKLIYLKILNYMGSDLEKFTYRYYNKRIKKEVISNN